MRQKSSLCLLILSTFLATSAFGGTWPTTSAGALPVCTASGDQALVFAVPDGVGGALTAWGDSRSGNLDVYAARVTFNADKPWAVNGIGVATTGNQEGLHQAISDDAGGAILCWSVGNQLLLQRIDANGASQWASPAGVTSAYGPSTCGNDDVRQCAMQLVSDLAGGAIAVWHSTGADLFAQRVNADGTVAWATGGVPVCTDPSDQYHLRAASDGFGGVITTWSDYRNGTDDIYAQRVDASGTPAWAADGIPVFAGSGPQSNPVIAADSEGGAIVAWQDYATADDARAQRIDANGQRLWAPGGVHFGHTGRMTMISDGAGGALVSFWPHNISGYFDLQKLASDGSQPWGTYPATPLVQVCNIAGQVSDPQMCSDGTGGAIVTWADTRNASFDVFSQRVTAAGAKAWGANGVAVATNPEPQELPVAVPSVGGGALVAYTSFRTSQGRNISMKQISAAGILGDLPTSAGFDTPDAVQMRTCNPCHGDLAFAFALREARPVAISITDVAGRIRLRMPSAWRGAGWHPESVDTRAWPAGLYIVTIESGATRRSSKAVVLH